MVELQKKVIVRSNVTKKKTYCPHGVLGDEVVKHMSGRDFCVVQVRKGVCSGK